MIALVIQHMPDEGAGILLQVMNRCGISVHVVEIYNNESIPPLDDFDLLLVMGGAQQVWETDRYPWLNDEIFMIRQWVLELQKPYFGVCLGHQLLAAALGGEVGKTSSYELGFKQVDLLPQGIEDSLFSVLPATSRWLQWHEAEVLRAPEGVAVMACSPRCAIQAMSIADRAVSLQFHIEATADLLDSWTTSSDCIREMSILDGAGANLRVRNQSVEYMVPAQDNAEMLFMRWLELNGLVDQAIIADN